MVGELHLGLGKATVVDGDAALDLDGFTQGRTERLGCTLDLRTHRIRHTGGMGKRLTLVANTSVVAAREVALPDGLTMRVMTDADAEALAQLYLSAYHPSPGAMSLIEAHEEMRATFAGEFGELWREASPVVVDADGAVLAAVMTVADAPPAWEAPAGPYVIEVFTSYLWRRRGLAGALLADAARTVVAAGRETVTLRVDPDNIGAIRLYAAAGFAGLTKADADGVARAYAVDMGGWLTAMRLVEPRRPGIFGNTKAASRTRAILAALVLGVLAVIVGFVVWVAAILLLSLRHHSYPVTNAPPVTVSATQQG